MPSSASSSHTPYPPRETEYYEGHLPSASATSIYPDTVPAGPLTDHRALTNDLRRAIGGSGRGDGLGKPRGRSRSGSRGNGIPTLEGRSSSQAANLSTESSGSKRSSQQSLNFGSSISNRDSYPIGASSVASRSTESSQDYQTSQNDNGEEPDLVLKGNLQTVARLGEGASGEVRKCRHRPTGLIMAVKTISTSPNPSLHRQILRELSFNRTCHSPYIVRYYGAFLSEDSQSIEIAMEFCEAGSLDSIYRMVKSRNGRTGEKILGKVAESVLKGLSYLHDRKIIHRDIKPSNIVLTRSGQIKLCDFGVSGELVNSLAGTFTGTSYYMAPERIKGLPYTITSDVWSLGLTILELASNRFPFPPEGEPPLGPIDLLSYIITMKTPELQDDAEAGIKWSRALRDFVERCLEKDGERRLGPKKMLTHPFVKKSETRQPQPDVGKFVAEVYGWSSTTRAEEDDMPTTRGPGDPIVRSLAQGGSQQQYGSPSSPSPSTPSRVPAEVLRIPSIRKAPSPLTMSTPAFAGPKPHDLRPPQTTLPTLALPRAPGMTPLERLDLQGRSEQERLESKLREMDLGLCGSPLLDAGEEGPEERRD